MDPYRKIADTIQEEAKSISMELIEIRMYEVDRLQAQLQVRIKQAINSSLKSFEIEGESELGLLLDQQSIIGTGNQILNRKISKLNGKLKEARRALHTIRDWDEYLSLKKYIRDKFGDEVMNDFYKDIPTITSKREQKEIANRTKNGAIANQAQ